MQRQSHPPEQLLLHGLPQKQICLHQIQRQLDLSSSLMHTHTHTGTHEHTDKHCSDMRAGHGCVIRPRITEWETWIVCTIDASFSLMKAAFCQKPLSPLFIFFSLPDHHHLRQLDGSTKAALSWIGTVLGDNAWFAFNSGLWQTPSLYHRAWGLIYMVSLSGAIKLLF